MALQMYLVIMLMIDLAVSLHVSWFPHNVHYNTILQSNNIKIFVSNISLVQSLSQNSYWDCAMQFATYNVLVQYKANTRPILQRICFWMEEKLLLITKTKIYQNTKKKQDKIIGLIIGWLIFQNYLEFRNAISHFSQLLYCTYGYLLQL